MIPQAFFFTVKFVNDFIYIHILILLLISFTNIIAFFVEYRFVYHKIYIDFSAEKGYNIHIGKTRYHFDGFNIFILEVCV